MSLTKVCLTLIAAASWFGPIFIATAAIDLTPEVNEYIAQGEKIKQLAFHEDKLRIEYEPPRNWSFSGSGSKLRLRPSNTKFAEAVIEQSPLAKPQPLDETVCNALKQKFLASLPAGSQFVKVEQEISNPVLLGGNPSFEIIVSYQVPSGKYFESALFVNVRDTQLAFYLTAPKDEFQALHSEFRGSMFSWHWLEEKPQAAATQSPNIVAAQ